MAVKSICWIVIRQKAWFLPDFFSVRLDGREISVFNGRKEKNVPIPELDNSPCLEVRGSFFYDYTLSPWYSKIEMSRHEGISKFSSHVLESIFNIESDKGESEVESKHLHIHIRSGDIFPGGGLHADIPNPKYGQPPLSFYSLAISAFNPEHITLVYENNLNPVIDHLENHIDNLGIPISVVSGTLEQEIKELLRARNIVCGRGTFIPGICSLSTNIERVIGFERFPDWGGDYEIGLIKDREGYYASSILSDNWTNSDSQRELMIDYPTSSLSMTANFRPSKGPSPAIATKPPNNLMSEKLISIENRFIYVGIPKVATRSILSVLRGDGFSTMEFNEPIALHLETNPDHRNFTIFSFVRNPWSRIYSTWRNKVANPDGGAPKSIIDGFDELYYNMPFDEFVNFVCTSESGDDTHGDRHWTSQHLFLRDSNGQIVSGTIGRLESLETDFSAVLHGLGFGPVALPWLNTRKGWVANSEDMKSVPDKYYRQFFTPELKNLIANRYKEDIDIFGYEF